MNRLKMMALAAALGTGVFGATALTLTTDAVAQATKLVFEQRSQDAVVTDSFEVTGPFEIRWTATGGKFLVKVLDADSEKEVISSPPQARENEDAPMTGSLPFTGPDTFKLGVEASGPWHIRVVEIQ